MTDKQLEEIIKMVKECKHKTFEVCSSQVFPCERVVNQGRCPIILKYLKNEEGKNE